jgi:enamine deaminase RidA (YjgF/YER057c/UK114 family)
MANSELARPGLRVVQPAGWPAPRGYANGIAGAGLMVMIGGQVGWDTQQRFAVGFVAQAAQALRNVLAVLHAAGGQAEHLARLTWYVRDVEAYRAALPALGGVYRDVLGRWYPAMTLVQVAAFVEREALLEIEATAIVPAAPNG